MNQRLVTLTGPVQDKMVDLARSVQYYKSLPDLEAGMLVVQSIGETFPDLTWNDFRPENWPLTKKLLRQEWKNVKLSGNCSGCEMSGSCGWRPSDWGNCVQNLTSDVKDGIGDSLNWIGDKGGETIRLLTDEDVVNGAAKIADIFQDLATPSEFELLMKQFDLDKDSDAGKKMLEILAGTGAKSKKDIDAAGMGGEWITGVKNEYLVYGGIGVFSLVLLMIIVGNLRK